MHWLQVGNLKRTAVRDGMEEVNGFSEVSIETYAKTK